MFGGSHDDDDDDGDDELLVVSLSDAEPAPSTGVLVDAVGSIGMVVVAMMARTYSSLSVCAQQAHFLPSALVAWVRSADGLIVAPFGISVTGLDLSCYD